MRSTWINTALLAAVILFGGSGGSNLARAVPWVVFEDTDSTSVCNTVNAVNIEFVVLSATGELKIITDVDEILPDTVVGADGFVRFHGFPIGMIDFAEDGDGFRTLWWLDLDGMVVAVDETTGVPFATTHLPTEFNNVTCDACELWDDPADCDEDLDGVPDEIDDCPGTPLNTFVTEQGCPCNAFDEDDDEINDCFDECPNTPFGAVVDDVGCEIVIVVRPPPVTIQPPPVTVVCGSLSTLTMALTFGTLVTLRLARRRHL